MPSQTPWCAQCQMVGNNLDCIHAGTSFHLKGTSSNMDERAHVQKTEVLLVKERNIAAGGGLSIYVKSNANAINNFLSGTFAHDAIILIVILH